MTNVRQKIVTIVPYDTKWPEIYEDEATLIKHCLGAYCLAIHHIGSTSIPGLCSKKDAIDILCIVDDLENSLKLQDIGYTLKGEFNIPLRYCFGKNSEISKVNLHVVELGHSFIDLQLCFRDYLRTHDTVRDAYAALKQSLVQDPNSHLKIGSRFVNYGLGKDRFIKGVLEQAGFQGIIFNFCMHDREWETITKWRNDYFLKHQGIQDPETGTFDHPDHIHMIMHQGANIVGYAHLERLSSNEMTLKLMIIDEPYLTQNFESIFQDFCAKWLNRNGYKML